MQKYKLTQESIQLAGRTLYRIRALKDFRDVKAGDLGGWVEKESNPNLSQDGDCWIYENAKAFQDAFMEGNASMSGSARMSGNAIMKGNARMEGNAIMKGNASMEGNARMAGNALVKSNKDLQAYVGVGSENGTLTAYRTTTAGIGVTRGCFSGTVEAFRQAVTDRHGNIHHYHMIADLIEWRFANDC